MKKRNHSETEIVRAVKELESGMDVSQLRELKALQEENRRLKQMYADLALDNKILRDVIEQNSRARDKGLRGTIRRFIVCTRTFTLRREAQRKMAKSRLKQAPQAVLTCATAIKLYCLSKSAR